MPKVIEDEVVYQAVIKVVAEYGYSGATTKQMADAADVSEVTLFRKYGNKLNLVREAIASILEQTEFSSAVGYTGELKADLTRVLQAYQDSAVSHGNFVFSLFTDFARDPDLVRSFDVPWNIFASVGKLIARYQDEGKLKREHPMQTVAVLLGPLMYTAMIQKTIPDQQIPPLDLSAYLDKFLAGRMR